MVIGFNVGWLWLYALSVHPLCPSERQERRRETKEAQLLGIGFSRPQSDFEGATAHQRRDQARRSL